MRRPLLYSSHCGPFSTSQTAAGATPGGGRDDGGAGSSADVVSRAGSAAGPATRRGAAISGTEGGRVMRYAAEAGRDAQDQAEPDEGGAAEDERHPRGQVDARGARPSDFVSSRWRSPSRLSQR